MIRIGFKIKRILFLCATLSVFLFTGVNAAASGEEAVSIYTFGDGAVLNTRISMQKINGENVIVMPSSLNADKVMLFGDFDKNADVIIKGALKEDDFYSGKEINLGSFCSDGDYTLEFSDRKGSFPDFAVRFLFSENIPAVFLVSDNPSKEGRAWVEESPDKSHKATGFMVIKKADGSTVYSGELTQIKGRGNSTWTQVKKPYQIKTDKKVDLLQTGEDKNKSKTWVLLANYMDPSLLNNSVALNLGKALGMKTNIESTHVDLYYDGEYRGNYLLSEKVEIGSGRVDIADLEEKNEEANTAADIEKLPINTATTANGAFFTYCEGMESPEDISGGYLLEMDYEVRAKEEVCYFRTTRGQYVVVKSPELASKEEMSYIASLYQEYEDAVFNGGVNPTTGKAFTDYVDAESVACYYLINEFTKARDFFASSAYLYKNEGEEKMYMGPLWDYDQSFAGGKFEEGETEHPYGASIYNTDFGGKLLEINQFAQLLKQIYNNRFIPAVNEALPDEKCDEISASAKINNMLWYSDRVWEQEAENLFFFIKKRVDIVQGILNMYPGEETRFRDVFSADWFYKEVVEANSLGYMNGVNKSFFDPYSAVSRSELAQVLFNKAENKKTYSAKFTDVRESDWFFDAVMWSAGEGIMQGFDDGAFRPRQHITREELIVCLYLYKNTPAVTTSYLEKFADADAVSSYAINAMEWAISEKIIVGDTDGRINAKANLTRAELAVILSRIDK